MNHLRYDYRFNDPFSSSGQSIIDHDLKINIDSHHGNGFYTRITMEGTSQRYSLFYHVYANELNGTLLNGHVSYDIKIEGGNILQERRLFMDIENQFQLHELKDVLSNHFQKQLMSNYKEEKSFDPEDVFVIPETTDNFFGNLLLVQVVFTGTVSLEIHANDGTAINPPSFMVEEELFGKRFENVLKLGNKLFDKRYITFAQITFSNLIGGLGFFHGSAVISSSIASSITNSTHLTLLSCSPSRPFFPRGFLWDEGFHLTLLSEMYPSLGLYIINQWLSLMDDNGWIMREVILGDEARGRVPLEFQMQFADYANPPSLILPMLGIMSHLYHNSLLSSSYDDQCHNLVNCALLKTSLEYKRKMILPIYQKFKRHFEWLRKSQKGSPHKSLKLNHENELYRWRGRTVGHCLTSGLDDYPRYSNPSDYELHVDLVSWIGFYADALHRIAKFLNLKDEHAYFESIYHSVKKSINVFWNGDTYGDLGYDSEKNISVNVIHEGYISLFPFLFNLSDETKTVNFYRLLKKLSSVCGIRSLAQDDLFYGKDEDYWRGKVWINLNYLILRSLKLYYWKDTESRTIYHQVRGNIINCMFEVWKKDGYVYEQYDDQVIAGRRSRPFNGWSSLITLIMSETYN